MGGIGDKLSEEKVREDLERMRDLNYTVRLLSKEMIKALLNPHLGPKYIQQLISAKMANRAGHIIEAKEMGREGYNFIVTHFHSSYSHDGPYLRKPFKKILGTMRRYKVDVLFVTDHDNNEFFKRLLINPPKEISKRYDICSDNLMITLYPKRKISRKSKPLYIINAQETHILSSNECGINKEIITVPGIRSYRSLEDSVSETVDKGGIQIITHPALQDSIGLDNLDDVLAIGRGMNAQMAVEAFNGGLTPLQSYANIKIEDYLLKHPSIPQTAGSDSHMLYDMSNCGIWIPQDKLDYSSGEKFLETFYKAISDPEGCNIRFRKEYVRFSEMFMQMTYRFLDRKVPGMTKKWEQIKKSIAKK